jgi:hypothetical protein
VLVPVALVAGVTVAIVDVVDVVPVCDRLMSTVGTVLVGSVVGVRLVGRLALIPMPVVLTMNVAIVEVVHVVAMLDRSVATARPMSVHMTGVCVTRHACSTPSRPTRVQRRLVATHPLVPPHLR